MPWFLFQLRQAKRRFYLRVPIGVCPNNLLVQFPSVGVIILQLFKLGRLKHLLGTLAAASDTEKQAYQVAEKLLVWKFFIP